MGCIVVELCFFFTVTLDLFLLSFHLKTALILKEDLCK